MLTTFFSYNKTPFKLWSKWLYLLKQRQMASRVLMLCHNKKSCARSEIFFFFLPHQNLFLTPEILIRVHFHSTSSPLYFAFPLLSALPHRNSFQLVCLGRKPCVFVNNILWGQPFNRMFLYLSLHA